MHLTAFIKKKPTEQVVYVLRRHPLTFLPYIFLFIVLLSVDAFALRFKHFVLITILMIASVLFSNLYLAIDFFSPNVIFIRTIIQLYSIAVTAVVMRFFAYRALSEKKEKEK